MAKPIRIEGIPGAHSDSCRCDSCRRMVAAICAQHPDGSCVFSDTELLQLAEKDLAERIAEEQGEPS